MKLFCFMPLSLSSLEQTYNIYILLYYIIILIVEFPPTFGSYHLYETCHYKTSNTGGRAEW